jgi:phosphomannomutase
VATSRSAPPDLPSSFKAYDIRGRVPDEIDSGFARRLARAYADFLHPKSVAIGHDARLSGPELADTLAGTLARNGIDVTEIGDVTTEELYFATASLGLDGGIMVTASHNPASDNGFKLVREDARPISAETGLLEIASRLNVADRKPESPGIRRRIDIRPRLAGYLTEHFGPPSPRPLRIVANAGNGMAGPLVRELGSHFGFEWTWLHERPDGRFPHGIPNPLLPENRSETAQLVRATGADLGLAWDGDADRCFFYDETGRFIESYYLVGVFAAHLLARSPGSLVVHDPRLVWNTREIVESAGGRTLCTRSGHAFIKEAMRQGDALYGGEMSGHHYFRDFFYCDSGMAPWLLLARIMSETNRSLSQLVDDRIARYPVSGEINRKVRDPAATLGRIAEQYGPDARSVDTTDGLSVEYENWRFNLRSSNTEPLLRLNLETRHDPRLLVRMTATLLRELERDEPG